MHYRKHTGLQSTWGRRLDFVKGHCGWDVVTLLPEGQVPPEAELASAIKILGSPIDGGLEVGWLGVGARPDEIKVRMVNSTTKGWIPMCGGMTQVIGKALIESSLLREHFEVDAAPKTVVKTLVTASGEIPIHIESDNGKVIRVTTVMDQYLSCLYGLGIERLVLRGVPVLRVGTYVVIDVTALEARYPGLDFTRRDPGPHLDFVNEVLRDFMSSAGLKGVNGMLYDDRAEGPGAYRVFPRFYSGDLAAARLPWEFQCGTGSIAVAAALAHQRRLPVEAGDCRVLLEWGSYRSTRDPYGIRTSLLDFSIAEDRMTRAAFSHSVVEILAEGQLTLPGY